MLQIQNVTYGYNAMHNVLENFSLQYDEPGIYGLLGKNGTGKSTLLYLIMGLLRPKQGEITFNGVNTQNRLPETLQEMFIVPEEYNLPSIPLPAYLKVLRPFYPNFDEQLMVKLLEMFDMLHVNGATLDENGIPKINLGALSMGQKKKVYMCIALAARTKLLLMDEPTNGLDIPSKSQFRKVVAHGMRDDQIVVISTHQVRDVETLLDHVTIIEQNAVLLNERMNMEEPVNLEELFIKALNQASITQQ
ncbi:MAG: ABC transporter ATP-binding protein [Bacteroidaceae bacterium]|nr:ABC transporter ATP-binding protein [Bacteroidaceae bacterium]MCI6803211.1 ABC transporter ATP-binding protein [Prevotellaceae bacterium]MDD6015428.1 ABC transporter ATP-binding protein [Prevotellaceae bacterium]MDD7526807.1 ABC transporter ATP-binding protein [Prevotellaceae bacterium]MDY5761260.1 ABC transporter ATP-binding protein [Bacteroidaceae bacterium]